MNPARLRAYSQLLIAAVIWGIAGPVIKLTLKDLPPDIFITYRFLISSVVAIPFFVIRGFKLPKEKTALIQLLLYALLNSSVSLGLLFWGTDKTSLLSMSLISLFGPLLLTIFGYFFLKDRVTSREKLGTLIAFIGAMIIGIGPVIMTGNSGGSIFGNVLIFLSLVSGAGSGVFMKKLMRKGVSPDFLANISFVVGFITILPFVILTRGIIPTIVAVQNLPFIYHLGVLYMAVISGNIGYILNNMGQKTIELSESAPFAYLYPAISAVLAIILLGDELSVLIVMGTVITFVGVFLAEIKKKRYN